MAATSCALRLRSGGDESGHGLNVEAERGIPQSIRSTRRVRRVRLLEQPHVLRDIVALLAEGFWIPFAALGGEEVAAIDVDGGAQPRDRVGHRMDDVARERLRIPLAQRLRAG